MKRIAKFIALSGQDRRAFLEAILCLSLARLMLMLPFRWLAPMIGRPEASAPQAATTLSEAEHRSALAIRTALARAPRLLPWHSSCLVCAIAGQLMLRRQRLPSVLHLGARTEPGAALSAHAWLRCGEVDVVGTEVATEFTPLAAFKA